MTPLEVELTDLRDEADREFAMSKRDTHEESYAAGQKDAYDLALLAVRYNLEADSAKESRSVS